MALSAATISFASKTLNKINSPSYASEYLYRDATEQYVVKIRHSQTGDGKDRHNVEAVHTVWNADPALNIVRKSYIVIELMPTDDTVALTAALAAFLTATTNEVLGELNDWEV